MAPPSSSYGNALGLEPESTFGTPATPGVHFRLVENSMSIEFDDALMPSAGGAGVGVPFDFGYRAAEPRAFLKAVSGRATFTVEVEADDIGFLLAALVGAPTYQVDTPVASTYTHQFKSIIAVPSAMPLSLTLAWNDNVADFRMTSFCPDGITFRAGAGDSPIQATVTGPFRNLDTTTYTVGSLSTAPWFEKKDSAVRYDAVGSAVTSADDLTGADAVADWELDIRVPKLVRFAAGSRLMREPVFTRGWSAVLTATKDWFDLTEQAIMRHATPASRFKAAALFLNTTTDIVVGTKYSLEWSAPAAIFQGDVPQFTGEIGTETIRLVAAYDGTNPPWQLNLINGTSGATAYTT